MIASSSSRFVGSKLLLQRIVIVVCDNYPLAKLVVKTMFKGQTENVRVVGREITDHILAMFNDTVTDQVTSDTKSRNLNNCTFVLHRDFQLN